jgi:dynactin complex subunit
MSYPTKKSLLTPKGEKLGLGDQVSSGNQIGTVAFLGETAFSKGEWIGLVLPTTGQSRTLAGCAEGKFALIDFVHFSAGKNDGTVAGVRYFECPPNCGLFIKPVVAKLVKVCCCG